VRRRRGSRAGRADALDLSRDEDGVYLNYAVNLELSRSVEDALNKAVPLFFVAEAQVFRDRWYWRDRRVADVVRVWRIVYQPLTSSYRITFGALTQTFATRAEALTAITPGRALEDRRTGADRGRQPALCRVQLQTRHLAAAAADADRRGGQPDWQISVTRTLRLN
jgi:hypothetical protein